MKILRIFLALTALGLVVGAASAQTNPQTQITWPRVTGAGVPTATCPSSTNTTTTATVGTPYTNTSANTQYVCSTGGWTLIGAGSGGITALTGDVTASGPGSAAATLATVNANTGTFGDSTHVPVITFDGKGRATAVTLATITGGGGCAEGTCIQNNPVGAQNVNQPSNTNFGFNFVNWPSVSGVGAAENGGIFDNFIGDTGGGSVTGSVIFRRDTSIFKDPGWSGPYSNSSEWQVNQTYQANMESHSAGIAASIGTLNDSPGKGDKQLFDGQMTYYGKCTAGADECATIMRAAIVDGDVQGGTITTPNGVGVTTVGISGSGRIGVGQDLLNQSQGFNDAQTFVSNSGPSNGITTITLGFNTVPVSQVGTTASDVPVPRVANQGTTSTTFGITIGAAITGTLPLKAQCAGSNTSGVGGAISSFAITALGSYSSGVQTVTADLIQGISAGSRCSVGGMINYYLRQVDITGEYYWNVVGSPDSTHLYVTTIRGGVLNPEIIKFANIRLVPGAEIIGVNDAGTQVNLVANNTTWNSGDSYEQPLGLAALMTGYNFVFSTQNPFNPFQGNLMNAPIYSFVAGNFNKNIGADPAQLLSHGGSGIAPYVYELSQGIAGLAHFEFAPESSGIGGASPEGAIIDVDGFAAGSTQTSYKLFNDRVAGAFTRLTPATSTYDICTGIACDFNSSTGFATLRVNLSSVIVFPTTTSTPTIGALAKFVTIPAGSPALDNAIPGTDYQIPISLTTTGSSGASTFNPTTGVLNIPNYAGGGSTAFSAITSGTNTGAAMLVGSGASLDTTGSGTINSSSLLGNTWAAPGNIGLSTPGAVQMTVGTVFQLGTATSSANFNSGGIQWRGSIWNGSTAVTDFWELQDTPVSTGTNPESILSITQGGSTGFAVVSVPHIKDRSMTPNTSPICPNGTDGAFTNIGCSGGSSGFPITLGSTSIAASSTTTTIAGLTVDGVSPTTFGFVDPTSSIQTQLNGKQASGSYGLTTSPLSQFAATTSAQLAGVISDETGSGALVFGTAPTITLGNATGLPLTTGVTGNLPNANLATQTANTVLGALTATTPSGLAVPSCSAATSALTWTSGTGFGCNTIANPLSGMTATQVAIAGSATTVTSSMPLATGGTSIATQTGSILNTRLVVGSTSGGLVDSGSTLGNVAFMNIANTFTLVNTFQKMAESTVATVASASTVAPVTPIVIFSGTTTIDTITPPTGTGALIGSDFMFKTSSSLTLSTAGNIESPSITTAPGILYHCAFFGTTNGKWNCDNPLNTSIGAGTVTATPGTGVTSVTCQTATCDVNGGTYTVVGGTATTGTFATLSWPTTTTAWRCTTNMNGGTSFLGLGHSVATATGMTVTSAVTIATVTFTFDYSCQP